ncbi:acyl-CoA dehydrogenase family protein [Micromonospora chalcea]
MSTMEDIELSAEDRALRDLVRRLAGERIAGEARRIDEAEEYPASSMRLLGEAGLFGLLIPERYGGQGAGMRQYALATEELARACAATTTAFITQTHAMLPILAVGDDEQKRRWLPGLAAGRALGAIAITEPEAGTDVPALATRAVRDGDGYVISGRKMFITSGGVADLITLFARTSPGRDGISVFVVEARSPGVRPGRPLAKMGIRASNTVELAFDEVRVPVTARLGPEGIGFHTAVHVLSDARISTAAQAVGIAQRAYDIADEFTRQRRQFGRPVREFQAVQLRLADMYIAVVTARLLVQRLARFVDAAPDGNRAVEAAAAKVYCSDVAMRVAGDAVQLMGGYGYMREFEAERCMRDAKITQIYDGTNDVNRLVLARQLAKRST